MSHTEICLDIRQSSTHLSVDVRCVPRGQEVCGSVDDSMAEVRIGGFGGSTEGVKMLPCVPPSLFTVCVLFRGLGSGAATHCSRSTAWSPAVMEVCLDVNGG